MQKDGQKKWRSFEEARSFARLLGLKREKEWRAWARSDKRPQDIPAYPDYVYRNSGWQGMGDWLATGRVANQHRQWRSFEAAREYARSLGLTSQASWQRHCKSGEKPGDIPSNPSDAYKNSGWINWGDWLGTGYTRGGRRQEWTPFEEAREHARGLGLSTVQEWREYSASGDKPDDIPRVPDTVYAKVGWTTWGDWLGTGANSRGKVPDGGWRPFEEARRFVRNLNILDRKRWAAYCKSGSKPPDIPASPQQAYEQWQGFGDWLGTGRERGGWFKKRRTFEEARKYARSLGLKSRVEWQVFCKTDDKPDDIPASPAKAYADLWQGWGDWLGTGTVAPKIGATDRSKKPDSLCEH